VSKTIKFVIAIVLIAGCLPVLRTQGQYDVRVTWTIRESTLRDHHVSFQGTSFVIPAGQSVTQDHRLRGGSQGGLLFSVSGWGLLGETLSIDGEYLSLSSIHRATQRGTFRILGMGRLPAMSAEIRM